MGEPFGHVVIVGAYAPHSGFSEEVEPLRGGDESVVYSRSARISRPRRVAEFLEKGFTVLFHLNLSAVRSEKGTPNAALGRGRRWLKKLSK